MSRTSIAMNGTKSNHVELVPTVPRGGKKGTAYWRHRHTGDLWAARGNAEPIMLVPAGQWTEEGTPAWRVEERATAAAPELPAPPLEPLSTGRRFAFTFRTEVDGVVGEILVEADSFKEVVASLRQVRQYGLRPLNPPEPFVVFPDGTAWCPRHNALMTRREKQGDTWYSHNCGTEESPVWCKGRPGKDSPGWEV